MFLLVSRWNVTSSSWTSHRCGMPDNQLITPFNPHRTIYTHPTHA